MIIATRTLTCASETGDLAILIEISAPTEGARGWRCPYTIGWPDDPFASEGWGYDPVQALVLTLEKIGIEIYVSAYHRSGRLTWTRKDGGYGFPVPKNGRDLLIGDDAKFFG